MKRPARIGFAASIFTVLAGAILLSGGISADSSAVTFSRDIAPILYENCVSCHRPGEIAPMSLQSYQEVRPWAKSIREVVATRIMPPWLADPAHGQWANDRRLSQQEIDAIKSWVDGGARQGDPKDLPPMPAFPEGWSIGSPDTVLEMTEEFHVPEDGMVPYKYYVVPTNFTEDKYVQAAEVRQGNRSLVHHVIVSVREPGQGPQLRPGRLDLEGDGRGGDRSGDPESARRGNNPDGMLVGWAPGMTPLKLEPGKAKLVKAGSVLIFQMHYTTNGTAGTDRTGVGLIFAKTPVEKRVITTGAFARNLVIPPGDPNYESKATFIFKEDSHIVSFMPHMHLRGKDFEYKLTYPDGTSKILLSVPRYDFNWQLVYRPLEPIAAPKGSRIECTAHHDNSTQNKFNPDPTKEVRWGQQTWEEMMIGWFDYTLDSQNLLTQTASK